MPKKGKYRFDWCTSVVSLALLGARWKIGPEMSFPVIGSWNDTWSNDSNIEPELLRGGQDANAVDSLRLPSKPTTAWRDPNSTLVTTSTSGRLISTVPMNRDEAITECLYLATTLTPPRLDKDFFNTFKSHYDKPRYHSLRLIRVSRSTDIHQAFDKYVVICNSRELRASLKKRFAVQSFGNDGSPNEAGEIPIGNSPVSLVRSLKQYVVDNLCHNLNCLKSNLEEAVRSTE